MDREVAEYKPDHTLDFYVEARNGKKRNYIYDYGKSIKCDHPQLKVLAKGDIEYVCTTCEYVFVFPGAYQRPRHHSVVSSMFKIMNFVKEFGNDSFQEVLRRPLGQGDGSPQKPVLPEGMSFMDVVAQLEGVDTTSEDGGAEELQALVTSMWESTPQQLKEGVRDDDENEKRLEEAHGESPPVPAMQGD